ncbi:GAF and ANTAR domain-containing protein [Streptomyces sp. NPDC057877]|uniref:GAF and ANTAR domain-containing protein n=1 Tax=Streptomyces sp. NPDC057877 TaxID=3346269 RepID=UPI0036B7C13D
MAQPSDRSEETSAPTPRITPTSSASSTPSARPAAPDALSASSPPSAPALASRVVLPSPEELGARNRRLARERVSRAEGLLVKRYGLASAAEGFELLKTVSQRSNVKLHTLADAVLRTPAPDRDAQVWFPGRRRHDPPRLPGLQLDPGSRSSQGAVLKAVLHRVLSITQTPMGNVQLMDGDRLHLTRHTGLNTYFTEFFAFVDAPTTACSQAAAERRQVTVRDVASADVFDEASRHAILQTGSRAAHSVPLTSGRGTVLGMVSSHHERPLAGFTAAQLQALRQTGTDVGRWLSWHAHTVVLDALEHLHATATRPAH